MTDSETHFYLSLQEVTCSFGIDPQIIEDIVDQGIVVVQKNDINEWRFDDIAVSRIQIVLRLHEDLGVNLAGAALALELLEEINTLRRSLDAAKRNQGI